MNDIDKAVNEITTPKPLRPVAVGDIFEMSWGYDQTNVNYFEVTRLSKSGVFVREIGAKSVPGTQGFMCETVKPAPGNFLDRSQWCVKRTWNAAGNIPTGETKGNPEVFRKVYQSTSGEPSFTFSGRYFARRIKADESTYSSWYA
jgi:hypothetical protein